MEKHPEWRASRHAAIDADGHHAGHVQDSLIARAELFQEVNHDGEPSIAKPFAREQ
jgi:hypothetical protein